MLEFTALSVIVMLYIFPLNLFLYYLSKQTVMSILQSQSSVLMYIRNAPVLSSILQAPINIAASLFYVLYVLLIFISIYFILKVVIVKSLYVYFDNEIDAGTFLLKYKRGQRNINAVANSAIFLILGCHLFLKVFDIKLLVLSILCLIFIFRKGKAKPSKKQNIKKDEAKKEEGSDNGVDSLAFEWYYNIDPLQIQQPVRFTASVTVSTDRYIGYQAKEHLDSSPLALREHVLDGICPEIVELAAQIKKQCSSRDFTTFHQASAVMSFQQSLRYIHDIDSKGYNEYVRFPLETLIDREGDCDCHGICAAAILFSMGYDVVLLRILFPGDDGHLAIAIEGADGIPGNFYKFNGKKYYYCEVTPSTDNAMNFKVGEMPDMPGANITVVPIKEIVTNL